MDDNELVEMEEDGPVEKWEIKNKIYRYEGTKGVSNLEKLTRAIGYDNLEAFLADNYDCCDNIVQWIVDNMSSEWRCCLELS